MKSHPAREPVTVLFLEYDCLLANSPAPPASASCATAFTGDTLLDAALDNGIDLPHECGGNCTCTTCHVLVEQGAQCLSQIEPPEDERLQDTPLRTPHSRLACQALLRRQLSEAGPALMVRILRDQTR